jgi:flagellar protein FlaH
MNTQKNFRATIIDSLTTFVSRTGGDQIQDFFIRCKSLCDKGQVVVCTVHDSAFDNDILTRVRSVCDAYLQLRVKNAGSRLLKTIEVAKIRGADNNTGNISAFEVEPGLGIRIIPISTARA